MYICTNCWYKTLTKLWKCPECWEFWTFKAEKKENKSWNILQSNTKSENKFFDLNSSELKRVFTNWIKSNWVYLLGWQPGVGKSTLVLQIIENLKNNLNIGYFSWEEEPSAIIARFHRITWKIPNFKIYHSTKLEDILQTTKAENLNLIIIDSIQTIYSNEISAIAWSVNQVKYCSEKLSEFSKKNNIASIIIWHITKSWEIAWPKYLEHIVDVVAYLEWDKFWEYRFLRTQKNRFWPTNDVAIFQMTQEWLKPVYNLKENLLQQKESIPGTVLTVWIDNWRPVLTTLEVLLNKTNYKFPKRTTIWVDPNRVELIIAILERYLNLNLGFYDIFINIPWEFKFTDSGLDLAIAAGILSAYKNKDTDKVYIGEISLSGKINKSKFHEKRKKEAETLPVVDYTNLKHISWLNF